MLSTFRRKSKRNPHDGMGETMAYSDDDIRQAVDEDAFHRGQQYRRQARVLRFVWDDGDTLSATVKGSGENVYRQTIGVARTVKGQIAVEGRCTCPIGSNCKHVVAALLAARASAKTPERGTATSDRSSPGHGVGPTAASSATIRGKTPAPEAALPPELAGWFERLAQAEEQASEDYPPSVAQRLVYVLSGEAFGRFTNRLSLSIKSTRLLKGGTFSTTTHDYNPSNIRTYEPARHLRPADIAILQAIDGLSRGGADVAAAIRSDRGAAILADILRTGRARWGQVNGPVLSKGPPLEARIDWVGAGTDSMRPTLVPSMKESDLDAAADIVVLNATPPVYVRPGKGLIGPLATELPAKIANTLLAGPPVPVAAVALLGQKLRGIGGAVASVAPPMLEAPTVVRPTPVPVLSLLAASLPMDGPAYVFPFGRRPMEIVPVARVIFRYDGFDVAASDKARVIHRMNGMRPIEIHRHSKKEAEALRALAAADLVKISKLRAKVPEAHKNDLAPAGGEQDWFEFLYDDVPELKASGWAIEIAEDFPIKLLRGDGVFEANVKESSGIDWFELDLGVVVDGERIDLVRPLIGFLATNRLDPDDLAALDERMIVHMPLMDGRFLSVPLIRIRPVIETLAMLLSGVSDGSAGTGSLRFSALDASALAALEAAGAETGAVWSGGERVRALGETLRLAGGIAEVAIPETFKAVLRPYQARGIAWLSFLANAGLGGVLADDMGLGKTVQALGLIAIEKAAGRLSAPVLVVAPTSLMVNWRREAEKFTPDLSVLTLQGLDRKTRFEEIGTSDIVLTTYPLIARDHSVLGDREWHMILLDEAQTIKNPNAATTKLIHGLKSRHRFCLSGTPLENHLGELWSLFHFVAPGFLGDAKSFGHNWRAPIERHGDAARAKMLAARVKPFLLRRTKDEVATDLPPKTEIVERVEFGPAQRDLYESVRLTMHDKVVAALAEQGLARSRIVVLDALLKMRQACCDPRLVKIARKTTGKMASAKLDRLMEMVAELLAEGRKILIFSQFTSMLDLIRPLLDEANICYALLTGTTVDREREVVAFQDGKVPVFLVSLKAGGVGLNLTAADTVILYDPWWNPAVENQAIDRAHRIGQDKPVFVHKLVAVGTIEEKIEILKARKQALAESIFDHDGAPTLSITEDDIAMLFEGA